jgi:hypothetical protein
MRRTRDGCAARCALCPEGAETFSTITSTCNLGSVGRGPLGGPGANQFGDGGLVDCPWLGPCGPPLCVCTHLSIALSIALLIALSIALPIRLVNHG